MGAILSSEQLTPETFTPSFKTLSPAKAFRYLRAMAELFTDIMVDPPHEMNWPVSLPDGKEDDQEDGENPRTWKSTTSGYFEVILESAQRNGGVAIVLVDEKTDRLAGFALGNIADQDFLEKFMLHTQDVGGKPGDAVLTVAGLTKSLRGGGVVGHDKGALYVPAEQRKHQKETGSTCPGLYATMFKMRIQRIFDFLPQGQEPRTWAQSQAFLRTHPKNIPVQEVAKPRGFEVVAEVPAPVPGCSSVLIMRKAAGKAR